MPSKKRSNHNDEFQKDEKVLVLPQKNDDNIHEATVLDRKNDPKSGVVQYKIHYKGWNKRWDEWVDAPRLLLPDAYGLNVQERKLTNISIMSSEKSQYPPILHNYICKACGAIQQHWIMDCPYKSVMIYKQRVTQIYSQINQTHKLQKVLRLIEQHSDKINWIHILYGKICKKYNITLLDDRGNYNNHTDNHNINQEARSCNSNSYGYSEELLFGEQTVELQPPPLEQMYVALVTDVQNVDFQQIKANGAPYNCPFCDGWSFQEWANWKQHWYQLHNTKYFDDLKIKIKRQTVIKNNKDNQSIITISSSNNISIEPKKKGERGRPRKTENINADKDKRVKTSPHRQKLCCKICNVNTTNNAGLSNHIRARHGMSKLDDYYDLNEGEIKAKQNEMLINDCKTLIGISATHKSRNIKYKYKCTICDNNNKRFYCAGHVGLNSHLKAHVKNGTLQDSKQKQLYKQIMGQKIPINAVANKSISKIGLIPTKIPQQPKQPKLLEQALLNHRKLREFSPDDTPSNNNRNNNMCGRYDRYKRDRRSDNRKYSCNNVNKLVTPDVGQ